MKFFAVTAVALALAGCTTVSNGAVQDITLTSNVENATCSISRNGAVIVPASPVPGTFPVDKRAGDLIVDCSAPGYAPQKVALVAGKDPRAVTGVLLAGLLVNVGTDAISHSWHEYQDRAYIHLVRSSN